MKKIFNYFKNAKWFKYWMAHIIVSLLISGFFLIIEREPLLSFIGAMYYLGREMAQQEEKGYFDYAGFFMPFVACLALYWVL